MQQITLQQSIWQRLINQEVNINSIIRSFLHQPTISQVVFLLQFYDYYDYWSLR